MSHFLLFNLYDLSVKTDGGKNSFLHYEKKYKTTKSQTTMLEE